MNETAPADHQVYDNRAESRFELEAAGDMAVSYYVRAPGLITITHTEVPPAMKGGGVGSRLIKGALDLTRAEGLRLEPQCPFVAAYIRKHPEYADLLSRK